MKSELSYDPVSGKFLWMNGPRSGKTAGYLDNTTGYIRIWFDGKLRHAHRLAWFLTYGRWPENEIDHINRDKTDNRLCNLRAATRSQNGRNAKKRNSHGLVGVSLNNGKTPIATIRIGGKTKYLGTFATIEEAHMAYKSAAGEFGVCS